MMRKLVHFLPIAAILWTWGSQGLAHADVHVLVNAANPLGNISQKEATDLFMGRTRVYPDGSAVVTLDLPRDSTVRAAFYESLTGLTQAQINSYWARLMFTGRTMPPQTMSSEQAMLEYLHRHPGAIGYLGRDPGDRQLRTILILKEGR